MGVGHQVFWFNGVPIQGGTKLVGFQPDDRRSGPSQRGSVYWGSLDLGEGSRPRADPLTANHRGNHGGIAPTKIGESAQVK